MTELESLYRHSLSLLTDLYQLTMAHGYWKAGIAEREAVFHLFFRKGPFGGNHAVACGQATVADFLSGLRFERGDMEYLATLTGNDGRALFPQEFVDSLGAMEWTLEVDAVPEGTVVFAHEPLVRVRGPLLQCQLIESALLNIVNFQTLIATKAARVCEAAAGDPVLEFGLRRAQGIDGALSASRAAYVGGCAATSNVLAGKLFGIPVKGTHAHSWVMCFGSEREAFEIYADAMPNNCVFLVDTYDTLEGVRHAIEVGKTLRQRGHELAGIRLDSGDLADLSIRARALLDEAGFPKAVIVASNDLDENLIASLKQQGAQIAVWGVGTKLATAHDQCALGGVYKLAALRGDDGAWQHKIKLSEQAIKISIPGVQQVRRYFSASHMVADSLYDLDQGPDDGAMFDVSDPTRQLAIPEHTRSEDLLRSLWSSGKTAADLPTLEQARSNAAAGLAQIGPRVRRLVNPHRYAVGLSPGLHELKWSLVARAREGA